MGSSDVKNGVWDPYRWALVLLGQTVVEIFLNTLPPPKKPKKLYFSRILRLILIIFICSHASNHISIEIVYFISPYLIIVIVCFSNTYIDKFIQNSKAYLDCLIIKKVRSSYVNVFVSLYVLSLINIVWLSIIPYINSGSKKETWNIVRKWHTARSVLFREKGHFCKASENYIRYINKY